LSFPLLSPRKYASFRQVAMAGIQAYVSGNDHNSYYHEMFVREYQLCSNAANQKKGEGVNEKTKKSDDR
jgi:hypothetical protein